MQIFFLDFDPESSAQQLCDKHVLIQIPEAAQFLSNAHWLTGGKGPYKLTHANHRCTKWVLESIRNYRWLLHFAFECLREYRFRYGSQKQHTTEPHLIWLAKNEPPLPEVPMTYPKTAMPDKYVSPNNVIESYRAYYVAEKKDFAKWTNRNPPSWFIESMKKLGNTDIGKFSKTRKTAK